MNILETSVKSDLLCARQSPAVLLPVKKKLLHTLLVLILWNGIEGKKMEQSLGWGGAHNAEEFSSCKVFSGGKKDLSDLLSSTPPVRHCSYNDGWCASS